MCLSLRLPNFCSCLLIHHLPFCHKAASLSVHSPLWCRSPPISWTSCLMRELCSSDCYLVCIINFSFFLLDYLDKHANVQWHRPPLTNNKHLSLTHISFPTYHLISLLLMMTKFLEKFVMLVVSASLSSHFCLIIFQSSFPLSPSASPLVCFQDSQWTPCCKIRWSILGPHFTWPITIV